MAETWFGEIWLIALFYSNSPLFAPAGRENTVKLVYMTGRTHDLAAFSALLAVSMAYPPASINLATILAALLANQIGGITPDIDEPTAPLWRNLPITGIFGKLVAKLLGGHRFLTHSILGLALFGYLAKLLLAVLHRLLPSMNMPMVWWAFMIGMASHLVMDTFTKEGVPWLLPIPIKFGLPPIRSLRITTGKWVEALGVFPLLVVLDIYLIAINYGFILSYLKQYVLKQH